MSIVLVIIGLITGGVMLGQSLIRQAQLNSVMTDTQKYIQAVQNFMQKYNTLPGDMYNATSYWGAMTTCPPPNGSASQGGILTCPGDGNGKIDNGPEAILAWQHLANAQMIQGSYTGIPGSAGSDDHIIGVNAPASRIDGSGFGIFWIGVAPVGSGWGVAAFPGTYNHIIAFGGYTTNAAPSTAILTSSEAFSLDNKYDDRNPATGSIAAWLPGYQGTNCATTSVASTAVYNIATTGYICSLLFVTGF